jgi:ketosteroid isomerase-like protein
LRKLDETELAGIRKREVKFVDAVYAPDVVMFPVYGPFKVEGLDRVREAWRSLYDTFAAITRCEWSERRYHASGPASAWMTCLWSLEGSNSDGQPLEMVLRVTRQYERRRGRWVVVHEHLSAAMR